MNNYEEYWFKLRNLLMDKQRSFENTDDETFKIASRTLKFILFEMDTIEYVNGDVNE